MLDRIEPREGATVLRLHFLPSCAVIRQLPVQGVAKFRDILPAPDGFNSAPSAISTPSTIIPTSQANSRQP